MTKLHEILAVENELQKKFKQSLDQTSKMFVQSPMLFMGTIRELITFVDDGKEYPVERQSMSATVGEVLDKTSESIIDYLNVMCQKESANQLAKADIIVNGMVLESDVPATCLLGLETKMKEIRKMFQDIPTLNLSDEWEIDEVRGEGVFKMKHDEKKLKTENTIQHKVLVEPTEHHPAQIEKWTEQVPVGTFVKKVWSGMLSPADKGYLLERVEEVYTAVRQARQRANCQEVSKNNVGSSLMSYIIKGRG